MNKDLRKRLEKAAKKSYRDRYPEGLELYKDAQIDGFIAGAEFGYKEAIKVAKEWLNEHSHISEEAVGNVHCSTIMTMNGILADFENDMNKLLEDKK